MGNDAKGYHEYLSWAIHGKNINYPNEYSYELHGHRFLKYSFGVALCQSPFYLIAALFESPSQDLTQIFFVEALLICVGASLFTALALFYVFKTGSLLGFRVTSNLLAVITLYVGTNLLCYSAVEPFMSHLYSLFAISGFTYHLLFFKDNQQKKHLYAGLLFLILVIAIRPFNAMIVFPLLIYVSYVLRSFQILIKSSLVILGTYLLQILLWYLQSGSLIYTSYVGEGFNWGHPEFFNVLFSFRKGLLMYSPLLLFGVTGLLFLFKQHKQLTLCCFIILLIYTYCISCWWHWPFGDSFGHRAFIDSYLFFGIGIGALYHHVKKIVFKVFFGIVTLLGVFLNIIQTWQYSAGILPAEYITMDKYFYQFLYVDDASKNMIGGINDIIPLQQEYLTQQASATFINMAGQEFSSKFSFRVDRSEAVSYLKFDFIKDEIKSYASEKAKLYFQINDSFGKGYYYYSILLNETPYDYETPNTKRYSYQVKMPPVQNGDEITVMFFNPEKNQFIVRSIMVKFLIPKH